MSVIRITDGNAFKLRITGQTSIEGKTSPVDMSVISSLVVNFFRRGRQPQTSTVDANGRIVAENAGNLAIGEYGVEMTGYYNGQPWRFFEADVFEIVRETDEHDEPSEVDVVPIYDVAITVSLGGNGVTPAYVTAAIEMHDSDEDAHPDKYVKPENGIPVSDLSEEVQDMIENGGKTKAISVNGGEPFTPDETGLVDLEIPLPQIIIDETVTGEPGTDAEVENVGTADEPALKFTIPRGDQGNGIASIEQTVVGTEDGSQNVITITDDKGDVSEIVIRNGSTGERGEKGPQGNSGYQGAAGELQIVNNLTDGGAAAGLSAEMGKVLSANIAYAVCSTEGAASAKTVSIAGYALKTGGCLIIKMTNKNTASIASLNINSIGAKYLFYNGAQANASNTWKDEETLIVFYDGTRYQSYNIQGGSAESKYFLNVNQITDNVYTLETAIPVALAYMQGNFIPRIKGFIIIYKTGATNNVGDWEIALYKYDGAPNDINFAKKNNWKILPDFSSVISEVKYKGAILNLNLFNDTVYTLTSAIAAAYDLMGAKRGLIIMFKVDSSGNFAYYQYTYNASLTETNFKIESYWVDWKNEIKTKTPIELIKEQGNFTDITTSPFTTYVEGKVLRGHAEVDTQKGTRVYTCAVKSKHKYKLACNITNQTTESLERFCFYDSEGNAIEPLGGSSYTFTESIGNKIYELTAPNDAATLKVVAYNIAIYEQTDYNYENSIPKNTNKDALSEVAKILDITGKVASPIEVRENYEIGANHRIVTSASGVRLYIFPNGYYHAQSIGHSHSYGIVAYDSDWNPVEVIAGVGIISNLDVYPVQGAKYIVFAGGGNADDRILQAAFLPKYTVPFHEDNPIPVKTSGLKILNLGNSFSQDTFFRIRSLINQANIQDCTIACGRMGGGTIEQWYDRIATQTDDATYEVFSNVDFPSQYSGYTLNELLAAENWDIIILQQRSAKADSFGSFFPYITELMSYIKEKVRNRHLCFMFNMVWASEGTYDSANKQHYNDIVNITKRMCAEVGITHVIPTGVGIQYGRQTDIETPMNWTRDALHLDLGAGRYLAAATAFQYIFGYTNGVDVRDYNAFRYTPGEGEVATPVTADNIDIINQCAADAVNNRFMLEEL